MIWFVLVRQWVRSTRWFFTATSIRVMPIWIALKVLHIGNVKLWVIHGSVKYWPVDPVMDDLGELLNLVVRWTCRCCGADDREYLKICRVAKTLDNWCSHFCECSSNFLFLAETVTWWSELSRGYNVLIFVWNSIDLE